MNDLNGEKMSSSTHSILLFLSILSSFLIVMINSCLIISIKKFTK